MEDIYNLPEYCGFGTDDWNNKVVIKMADHMTVSQRMVLNHYTTVLLIVLCGIKLYSQKKTRGVELRYIWLTLSCCALLVVQDILESYAAQEPTLRLLRISMASLGYILRPIAAVSLLMSVCWPENRTWKLWIPIMVNTAINLTAFFSPIAFSFDEEYEFVRGPLGFVVFGASYLYLILILLVVLRRFYEGKSSERWLLVCCVFGVLGSTLVDALLAGCHLNEAIMIGCIFVLFYLRTHDNYLDPLTSLRNRFAYYDDSENMNRNITAIASIDMNGLKRLNDTQGHAAGDAALAEIGKCLQRVNDRRTLAYRMGGDEFVVVFISQSAQQVEVALRTIHEDIVAAGYSVSVGYAMKTPEQSLDDALFESDQNMYREKAEYYRQFEKDRRSRRS